MAAIPTKTTLKNLKNKGFTESSGDHHYLEYWHDGKLVLFTKISHGSDKDIRDPLIKQMSHQCKLGKKDFIAFAKCDLSEKEYHRLLQEQGLVP